MSYILYIIKGILNLRIKYAFKVIIELGGKHLDVLLYQDNLDTLL